MKRYQALLMVLCFGVSTVSALANQPPGPRVMGAEILLPLLMILICKIAGYYPMAAGPDGDSKPWRISRIIGAVVVILFSGVQEGLGAIVALGFGSLAIFRAIRMIYWGFRGATEFDISPRRLKVSGIILLMLSLFLTGQALAFVGYWPEIGQERREKRFQEFVAFQLAYASLQETNHGQRRFHKPSDNDPREIETFYFSDFWANSKRIEVEYGPDATTFVAYLSPPSLRRARMPIFPYNYTTSQPSLRADETGQIRMLRVHHDNERCPADAPVVGKVTAAEVERIKEVIKPLVTQKSNDN